MYTTIIISSNIAWITIIIIIIIISSSSMIISIIVFISMIISIIVFISSSSSSSSIVIMSISGGGPGVGGTNQVVSNRVVSKGPLYPSKTKTTICVVVWYDPVCMPLMVGFPAGFPALIIIHYKCISITIIYHYHYYDDNLKYIRFRWWTWWASIISIFEFSIRESQIRTNIHTYIHTYITYIHTHMHTYIPTYLPTYLFPAGFPAQGLRVRRRKR